MPTRKTSNTLSPNGVNRRASTERSLNGLAQELAKQACLLESLDLPDTDGVPLESTWHRACINLLIESVQAHFRGRSDYCVGGNLCFYYSIQQVRNGEFFGPDFFFVHGPPQPKHRDRWAVWEQGGRYPDVVIELLSDRTAHRDRNEKKEIYRGIFHTSEYFLYDPSKRLLDGFRLLRNKYIPIEANSDGRMWSEELELWIGKWEGRYQGEAAIWLRFFDSEGQLVPIPFARELSRAEHAEKRTNAAQAEIARLKAILAKTQKS